MGRTRISVSAIVFTGKANSATGRIWVGTSLMARLARNVVASAVSSTPLLNLSARKIMIMNCNGRWTVL